MTTLLTGFFTCLALIMAIGAQSAWLLRQGLRRDRVGTAVLVCLIGDLILIGLGTLGVGTVLDHTPWLMEIVRWLGVTYLVWFAVRSFASARTADQGLTVEEPEAGASEAGRSRTDGERGTDREPAVVAGSADPDATPGTTTTQTRTVRLTSPSSDESGKAPARSLSPVLSVVAAGLMVSLLNPHAWVDTMVVIGSMATSFGSEKWIFSAGAVLGSLSWFLLLAYGGRALAPVLNRPRTWQIIDIGVGVTMLVVAGLLAFGG
ncbi:LysE/ArgO family amino acid transporter [Nesterenkonia sp. F]|uniref:LysE/ArgO family amino acid transporter n=1 Tax=Nesterenkonia sp. F TaxID=795955 RepID=UPI00030FA99C|nr:LysE family transporter [Nesterenkonia sp. F]